MLVGYNTNISYKGVVYHVQTEDSGISHPHIITLLYHKGTILARKKVSYAAIAASPDYKDKVREMMKEQHKTMIKELIHGQHTQTTEAAAEPQDMPEPAQPAAAAATEPASVLTESEQAATEPVNRPEEPEAAQPLPEQREPSTTEQKAQISRSLDDILLDYILRERDS